jgi:Bacterial regulatory proteins, luxR family
VPYGDRESFRDASGLPVTVHPPRRRLGAPGSVGEARRGCSQATSAGTVVRYVTIKTVEVHLSHAYRKLEISSRTQLDTALLTPAPSPAPASA